MIPADDGANVVRSFMGREGTLLFARQTMHHAPICKKSVISKVDKIEDS
jgi:hypothetical protein